MSYFLIIFQIFLVVAGVILSPLTIFAQTNNQSCLPTGYTIATINGVFTNKKGATENRDNLKKKLPDTFNSEPLTVDFFLNPSHLGGIGDLAMVVYQKIFDNETVRDYDLVEMLKSASEKVKTQKILLVAHSQGNFYANSFYDSVADKPNSVPAESIGVYSVATPAGRVAGGGKWLTSDTDKVIAGAVGRMPFKNIMKPNTRIEEVANDSGLFAGHNFSNVYLKYRGGEIVYDIQASLEKLKTNTTQDPQKPCLNPPKISIAHKLEGMSLAVADPIMLGGREILVDTAVKTYQATLAIMETTKQIALAFGSLVNLTTDSPKLSAQAGAAALSLLNNDENVADNGALLKSVVSQNQTAIKENQQGVNKIDLNDIKNSLDLIQKQVSALQDYSQRGRSTEVIHSQPATLTVVAPRLLFVGAVYPGFGGGGDGRPASQVIPLAVELLPEEDEQEAVAVPIAAPVLSAPQCEYSLAADGCLLATTTVSFIWPAVPGAAYYAISKNGQYATTTEISFTATISDFSDYTFAISAMSSATTSATSTKTVSIATIPIAINEIAWMGTGASSNDEWMELKNNTAHSIDLSQWAIESKDTKPYINLAGIIAPREYRVLERKNDDVVADVSAGQIYGNGGSQWALENNGEQLILFYASTTLDQTPEGAWVAGDNASSTARKTMERVDSKNSGGDSGNWATWGTNINFIKNGIDDAGNPISGTPGSCNSASYESINNGEIIEDNLTLPSSCYYVSDGVMVSASSTLIINAGAQVSLYQNGLIVDGVLDARGEAGNPVVFDSFSGGATTNKIKINGDVGTSTLYNVVISNTGGVILDNGAKIEIADAEFVKNRTGVELNDNSIAVMENTNFASTTNEAIAAYGGSAVSIASSTIANTIDADAISVYDSIFSIASSTISNILDGDGMGLYTSTSTIANVTVKNIDSDGIGIYGGAATIASTTVSDFGGSGIYISSGTSVSGNAVVDGTPVVY